MEHALRTAAEIVGRAVGAGVRRLGARRRARSATVSVAANVDAALMASAAALRRVGGRITRYDADETTLEARLGRAVVTVRASAETTDVSRLDLSTDAPRIGAIARRFRRELARRS
jgi:hypothetical protein